MRCVLEIHLATKNNALELDLLICNNVFKIHFLTWNNVDSHSLSRLAAGTVLYMPEAKLQWKNLHV